jgi:hypothetical protein
MPLLIKPPTSPSNSVISKLIAENLKQKAENALLILYCSRLENHMKVAESTSTSSSLQSLIALKQQVLFNRLDICEKVVSEILPTLRLEDYKIKEKDIRDAVYIAFDKLFIKTFNINTTSTSVQKKAPTFESVLGIMAEMGHLQLIKPLLNLSKSTRNCSILQTAMREVKNIKGETQLHYFCRKGLTKSVERMLSMKGIDIESKFGRPNWTCLMSASIYGHTEICKMLLNKGASLKAIHKHNGTTPLHFAAQNGSVDIIKLFADYGADLEARDYSGCRAIHWAAIEGHLEVVKELVAVRKVYLHARHNDGDTALTFARLHKHLDIANFLTTFVYDSPTKKKKKEDQEEEEEEDKINENVTNDTNEKEVNLYTSNQTLNSTRHLLRKESETKDVVLLFTNRPVERTLFR